MIVLFDSTVLIDSLNFVAGAMEVITRHPDGSISIVSWIEVMAGARNTSESETLRGFLSVFRCLPLDDEIAEQASILRREKKLKLPDAIIFATAQVHHATLVTRNTRDFSEQMPGVRVPYKI